MSANSTSSETVEYYHRYMHILSTLQPTTPPLHWGKVDLTDVAGEGHFVHCRVQVDHIRRGAPRMEVRGEALEEERDAEARVKTGSACAAGCDLLRCGAVELPARMWSCPNPPCPDR